MGVEHSKQIKQQIGESGDECEGVNPSLEVNSMVQITLDKGNQVSGIIRWLGYLPHTKHKMAGVELVRTENIKTAPNLHRALKILNSHVVDCT